MAQTVRNHPGHSDRLRGLVEGPPEFAERQILTLAALEGERAEVTVVEEGTEFLGKELRDRHGARSAGTEAFRA
ncbi:hypothetical protein ACFXG4_14765 [Nocardia sp. NPDC059246]|uniref:hypothetical protein n=1 Tax=unclassified Nocardia TaxID=2637762 RepID=UPI0036769FFC